MVLVRHEVAMDPLIALATACAAAAAGAGITAGVLITRARRSARAHSAAEAARLAAALAREQDRLAAEARSHAAALEAKADGSLREQRAAFEAMTAKDRELAAGERTRAAEERARVEEAEARAQRREAKLSEREQAFERTLEAADRRETRLREREDGFAGRERELAARGAACDERGAALDEREASIDKRLAAISGLGPQEAREEVMRRLEASLADEQARRIARHEKELTAKAKELGVEIVSRAIQRYAAEHTAESTITRVPLADEDLKGRIIGKEGRNIKSFEQATGVDLLIDETPGAITISCFSGLRREMARRTLVILLEDGRIHPGRIEEVMLKVQQDMDREVVKLGEDAAFACEVSGLHPQLIKLLGKLHWRTSYGQNVLKHTQEVAFLCAHMASDLGLDPKLGRRCGLLHDIGKAIDHEQEGSHPELGYEALKRYGENEIVANAALAHHEGHAVLSAYTVLAAAADAISAARPGARSKNVEGYIKRLEQIEEIACSFQGVQKAYAIQAGRELRVMVSGREVADGELPKLARDIARRIEDEVAYPGEVKVTLIRELRHFAVAR
jgi:ribonuclease Y